MNFSQWKSIPKTALIKNGLYRGSLAFLLYRKLPLEGIFALSLYWKWPLLAFIENGLFSLYPFIKKQPLYHFIENGLYGPLSKTAFFAWYLYHFIQNDLYQKWPFLLDCCITLSTTDYISLYRKWHFLLCCFI